MLRAIVIAILLGFGVAGSLVWTGYWPSAAQYLAAHLDSVAKSPTETSADAAGKAMRPAEPASKSAGSSGGGGKGKGGGQQVAVETAKAVAIESSTDLRAIGSLQSDESVQISSEIAGRVTEIPFAEGGPVKQGDIIIQLDEALVRAEVADAEARFEFASGNLGRANTLARSGNVTERARDEATTNAETSRAALELAKTRLSKHVIRAPFPGVVGIRRVSPGAYVAVGQAMVNLEKIDTLKLDFQIPETNLAQVKPGQKVEVTVDAIRDRTFEGEIYAIDPMVDVNGRALRIRARLANPDGALRPGLFARVLVKGPPRKNVLVVPEAAIVPRGADKIVYRVENGRAVEAKVTLGLRKDGLVEVVDGLGPDAVVVTAGQQKLRDGAAVEVVASGEGQKRKGA